MDDYEEETNSRSSDAGFSPMDRDRRRSRDFLFNGESFDQESAERPDPITLNTRLSRLAAGDDTAAVEQLILKGAKLTYRDGNDRTPLHKAASSGSSEMIELLLQYGAEVDAVDRRGKTPLHIACSERKYRDPESAVRVLVNGGADINKKRATFDKGPAALHMVAQANDVVVARFLIEEGADVDVRDDVGRTPLHRAAAAGDDDMVKALTECGAEIDAVQESGESALNCCLTSQSTQIMDALLRCGADTERVDKAGRTILHLCCLWGWREAVELLLKHGADIDKKDHEGRTAIDWAKAGGRSDLVRLIKKSSRKPKESPDQKTSRDAHRALPEASNGTSDQQAKERQAPKSEQATVVIPISKPGHDVWDGVQRDNGDGFTLAKYNDHDISFDAKLESIVPDVHEGKDMHSIQIKINFMRPYSLDHRIRYANIDVVLEPAAVNQHPPNIRGIMPQADRMEVSEQEITTGKTFTVGAAGSGGPSNVNISMEGSKSRRSTFKGVRIIHGAIKDRMHASWRLYEEPGSKSGLPEIVRLLLLVHSEEEFRLRLAISVKACHFLTFGIPRTLSAPTGPSYTVPKLSAITGYQQASRLEQMLNVADRAALVIEDANQLEALFSQAMRGHEKREMIMQAKTEQDYFQQWSGILEDSQLSDFRALREKLLEMEERDRMHKVSSWEAIEETVSDPDSEPDSLPSFVRRNRRRRTYDPDDYERKSGRDYEETYKREYGRSYGREYERDYRRGIDKVPPSGNALKSFSAVGPGYHVSRLA